MVKREENEDNVCHWEECLQQFDTADDLFSHVCAAHIGRKSAGTLSLECKWTGCRAKASKRDHLTSHCRVHVALKPHVCSICTKAFKRPQDLKKHEKIHTEEHQAQHQRVSKAAAAGMNGKTLGAGKLGAEPRNQATQLPTSAAPNGHFPGPYHFSFPPPLGYAYPGHQQSQPPPPHSSAAGLAPGLHQPTQPGAQPQPQFPLGGANADQLAQFIALQQQLNSQAQMAAATGLSLPSQSLPGLQAGFSNALAMQLNQMIGAQAMQYLQGVSPMYPYGGGNFNGFPASAPPPQPNATSQPGSHAPLSMGMPAMGPPMTSAQPHSQPQQQQQQQSLYPSLPNSLYAPNGSSVPPQAPPAAASQQLHPHAHSVPPMHHTAKPEDQPSPASSSRSRDSGSYSSSLSPRNLPALSPASSLTPENSFSPTPGFEEQQQKHKLQQSEHQVAGKKRGFEEATGQLLSNLTNKRFHDADAVNAQLDSLGSFLLTPDVHEQPLPVHLGPNGHEDDGASSSGSEHGSSGPRFKHEDVDAINQLLLSLNQSLDSEIAPQPHEGDLHGFAGSHGHHPTSAAAASYPTHVSMAPTSLYPSRPTMSFPNMYGQSGFDPATSMGHLPKSVPAPSLAHDYRPTQYNHVNRLQRAAPSTSAPPQIEPEMEIDEDVKDAAEALLLAGSLTRAQSAPTTKPSLAAPTSPDAAPTADLRLPPIHTASGSSSRLPPIRDLLAFRSSEAAESPSSPVASSSSSSSGTAPPLYPSLASIATSPTSRPVSSGGVERLTHRVHKLRLPSTSSSGDEPAGSIREDEADLSASSGEEDEDRPTLFKKSRVESPMPMHSDAGPATPEPVVKSEEEEDDAAADVEADDVEGDEADADEDKDEVLARQEREAHAKVVARRKAVIAYLAMYVNHKYREQLARKSMAQVRKAIKKPSPLSQEQPLVKAET